MKFNYLFAILIILFTQVSVFGQQRDVDSLDNIAYNKISDDFFKYEIENPLKAKEYAQEYIEKGKQNRDSIRISNGYCFMSYVSSKEEAIKYLDSILLITRNSSHRSYPTLGFLLKGDNYYNWGDYQKALSNFLDAYPLAIAKNNIDDQLYIQKYIAILKNRWGNYEEALTIYKDMLSKLEKQPNYKTDKKNEYLISLYNLSLSYTKNKKLDSSLLFINRGIKESLMLKDSSSYYSFVFTSGTLNYDLKKYDLALDSINKALPKLDRDVSKSIANYYKAKIYQKQGMNEKCIYFLLKVDSIFQETQDEFPELTDAYQILSNNYKKKKDLDKQLVYLNKLLYVDSILDHNYLDINKMIVKRYDTPILLKEKNTIIKKLKEKKDSFSNFINLLVLLIVLALLFIFYLYHRNINYKKRFDELIKNEKLPEDIEIDLYQVNDINEDGKINLSKAIIENITNGLDKFEINEGFKDTEISVQKLAKNINTNSNYLSKVINNYKKKNFSNYINDLRINYAIERLKNDSIYRRYTIEAIANDSGFNKAQSFSSAFYKKTGIKPSYFINELNRI